MKIEYKLFALLLLLGAASAWADGNLPVCRGDRVDAAFVGTYVAHGETWIDNRVVHIHENAFAVSDGDQVYNVPVWTCALEGTTFMVFAEADDVYESYIIEANAAGFVNKGLVEPGESLAADIAAQLADTSDDIRFERQ